MQDITKQERLEQDGLWQVGNVDEDAMRTLVVQYPRAPPSDRHQQKPRSQRSLPSHFRDRTSRPCDLGEPLADGLTILGFQ